VELTLDYLTRLKLIDVFSYAPFQGARLQHLASKAQDAIDITDEEKKEIGYRLVQDFTGSGVFLNDGKATETKDLEVSRDVAQLLLNMMDNHAQLTVRDKWAVVLVEQLRKKLGVTE